MTEPTDAELLEFVARFVGWTDLRNGKFFSERLVGKLGDRIRVPDYLKSVDWWLADVWPKVAEVGWLLEDKLDDELKEVVKGIWMANATARQRCLALYHALDGKLPPTTKDGAA